jgi:hypothetical protein
MSDESIMWSLPTKCIVENAVYRISLRLRSHQTSGSFITPVQILMYLKGGNAIFEKAGDCTEGSGKWVDCQGYIKIRSSLLENASSFTMHLQKVKGGAFDVDDVRYEHP